MDIDIPGFRVLESAGRGHVHRAETVADGSRVGLKLFPPDRVADAQREADIGATLDHPHVLCATGLVAGPNHVALVFPWVDGGSLAELVEVRGRLPWREVLTAIIPLADALACAHERGIVHGDLSAANVLLESSGRPVLADLGSCDADRGSGIPVAATPTDVAPEIVRGAAPSPSADLFSLGSVALRALTGRPAWPADSFEDVLVQSTAGQWPDPGDLLAPAALAAVIRRLLDRDPDRRGSAARAATDLRRVGRPRPITLPTRTDDGTVMLPAPATVVRPDALRPPAHDVDADPGRWQRWRTALGDAARRDQRGRRILRAAVVLAVIGALGVGALRTGLWWAARDTAAPVAVAPTTPPGQRTPPLADRPPGSPPAAPPAAPPEVRPEVRPDPPPAAQPHTRPAGSPDWLAIVRDLDRLRARALVAGDAVLLDRVYTATAPAKRADRDTIASLVASGHRLHAAAHRVRAATVLGTDGDITRVAVDGSVPAYQIRDGSGTVVGTSRPADDRRIILDLARVDDGYRIERITASTG